MARKETILFDGNYYETCFNVSATVGVHGSNHLGDVMLIQAIFNYIAATDYFSGLGIRREDLPEVSGHYNSQTGRAIRAFQTRWMHVVLSVDGLTHPASYQNRILVNFSTARLMTITLLHSHANVAARAHGHVDYTEGVPLMFPKLRPHVVD